MCYFIDQDLVHQLQNNFKVSQVMNYVLTVNQPNQNGQGKNSQTSMC